MADGALEVDPPPRMSRMAVVAKYLGISALAAPVISFVLAGKAREWSDAFLLLALPLTGAAVTLAFVAKLRIAQSPRLLGMGQAGVGFKAGAGALVLFLLVVLTSPPRGHRMPSGESSAVGSVRTINTAEVTYSTTYPKVGFSFSLGALGGTVPCSASSTTACLIDPVLASGRKSGYVFTYTPGAPDAKGVITTYSVTARPQEFEKSGRRSFYADETGVIRFTAENRPPTAQDPPLQ